MSTLTQFLYSNGEIQSLAGLQPSYCWVVGAGYSREELKDFLFKQGLALGGEAVLPLLALAEQIVGKSQRLLGDETRQAVLRELLSQRQMAERLQQYFPEIRRLKRRRGFFAKLDRALQTGRLCFAHEDELAAQNRHLQAKLGKPRPLRVEMQQLAVAYEAYLQAMDWVDPPLLLRQAVERLQSGQEDIPFLAGLEGIRYFSRYSLNQLESLEQLFWTEIQRRVPVHFASEGQSGPSAEGRDAETLSWNWQQWHSADDAVEVLADRLQEDFNDKEKVDVLLMPDEPALRRSLRRALEARGLPLEDPRDPTQIQWDERVKRALLPIRILAHNFDRQRVQEWLLSEESGLSRSWDRAQKEKTSIALQLREISERGIQNGLSSYQGGRLEELHQRLQHLQEYFGKRQTVSDLQQKHLEFLEGGFHAQIFDSWAAEFFKGLWQGLVSDTHLLGRGQRALPLRYWLERLEERLERAAAPVEKLKPQRGIRLYRLSQLPHVLPPQTQVHILGLPPHWLQESEVGDYWYSVRERELLAAEFPMAAESRRREERLSGLVTWMRAAQVCHFYDFQYAWDGRERSSLAPALKELAQELGQDFWQLFPEGEPELLGCYPSRVQSFGFPMERPPQDFCLEDETWLQKRGSLTASALDDYSRCAFIGLSKHRWRLFDGREAELDLWPDVMGNLLHAAAKELIQEKIYLQSDPDAALQSCVEKAWQQTPMRGLLKQNRQQALLRKRVVRILKVFLAKERPYAQRSQREVVYLDDEVEVKMQVAGTWLKGKPDRVDRTSQGLFVMDYKSGSDLPTGKEVLEKGYRLQMPFYALALQEQLNEPVLGTQYVELNLKGGRSKGIFFAASNGKEEGMLTQVTARNTSLMKAPAEEVWPLMQQQVEEHVESFAAGRFAARPKKDSECRGCRYSDLCGKRRVI